MAFRRVRHCRSGELTYTVAYGCVVREKIQCLAAFFSNEKGSQHDVWRISYLVQESCKSIALQKLVGVPTEESDGESD